MIKENSKSISKQQGSINPQDEMFNFDLWAKEVKFKMIQTLEKRINSQTVIN